jgi:hypothetical protein
MLCLQGLSRGVAGISKRTRILPGTGWELRRLPAFTGGDLTFTGEDIACASVLFRKNGRRGMFYRPVSLAMEGKAAWKYSLDAFPASGR